MKSHRVVGPENLRQFLSRRYRCEFNELQGVYLWTVRLASGDHKVCYVGQSIGPFRTRLLAERRWDLNSNPAWFDLGAYARGERVACAPHSDRSRYIDDSYGLTWAFFIPLNPGDSPFQGESSRNRSLYKPLESAILRRLDSQRQLRPFVYNFTPQGRGVEMHEPKYPCSLVCTSRILGVLGELPG